jgi:hypothetical protein
MLGVQRGAIFIRFGSTLDQTRMLESDALKSSNAMTMPAARKGRRAATNASTDDKRV